MGFSPFWTSLYWLAMYGGVFLSLAGLGLALALAVILPPGPVGTVRDYVAD